MDEGNKERGYIKPTVTRENIYPLFIFPVHVSGLIRAVHKRGSPGG